MAKHGEGKETVLLSQKPYGCDEIDLVRWRNSIHRDFTVNRCALLLFLIYSDDLFPEINLNDSCISGSPLNYACQSNLMPFSKDCFLTFWKQFIFRPVFE